MLLPIITDTHLGARNDSSIFMDYFMKFYDELFFPTLLKNKFKHFLHLGDFWDRRKYVNFQTLNKTRSGIIDRIIKNKMIMYTTLGNHDAFFKGTNTLNSVNELMGHSENIKLFIDPHEVTFDGRKILLLPWINPENEAKSLHAIKTTDAEVVAGHLQLIGFDQYRGQPAHEGMDPKLFDRFKMVLTGHFHHKSSRDNIHYLGSPYQMTFNDYQDPRGFHILNTDTLEMEFIQNPHEIFHKLVYDDTGLSLSQVMNKYPVVQYQNTYVKVVVEHKTNPYYFDKLIDRLYKVNPANVSIIEEIYLDDSEEISENIEAEDTLSVLHRYVDNLEFSGDKNKLKDILRSLYNEANNMDLG